MAPIQAGRAVGQGAEPLCPSWVLAGDEARGPQDWPTLGSCTASTTLLLPCLALHLAPEPSNPSGKDKRKPCVHTPMDLTTRQWFPGQRLDFRIWEEEPGMVCLPGGRGPVLECISPLSPC